MPFSHCCRADDGMAFRGLFFACPIGAAFDSTSPRPAELCQQSLERAVLERHCTRAAHVFLSEGTLVIASPNGTPALGRWQQQDQTFTMIEEGIAYAVEILELTENRFRIRIRNPGEPVEMTLVPAAR